MTQNPVFAQAQQQYWRDCGAFSGAPPFIYRPRRSSIRLDFYSFARSLAAMGTTGPRVAVSLESTGGNRCEQFDMFVTELRPVAVPSPESNSAGVVYRQMPNWAGRGVVPGRGSEVVFVIDIDPDTPEQIVSVHFGFVDR